MPHRCSGAASHVAGSFFIVFTWVMALASARDLGQWENQDPKIRKWFNSLMIPDLPAFSCCGKSDAYWSDISRSRATSTSPSSPTRATMPRSAVRISPSGTRIPVPNHRIKWDQGNPTGHGWIFIGGDEVFCYLPPGGV